MYVTKSYRRLIKHNVNREFASSDSKNECTSTKNVFLPYMKLSLGQYLLKVNVLRRLNSTFENFDQENWQKKL